ncbi:MAG TPA: histone deacetylase family protein [Rhodanobacteraceae bacterium]|nr:histone deacetylase family protein [Rhodanobacteraceae bacterium]
MRLYTHPACLQHDPGPGHPESPARLRAVLEALDHPRFAQLERLEAPRASREQLLRVHEPGYVESIYANAPQSGSLQLDPDTVMSPASLEAAERAAGAVCAAVDAVMANQVRRAFCAVRPPGHHATRDAAMGFCIFNGIAVGAAHALATPRLERVAILDPDVHHGNGTQDIFAHESRVLYLSSHQMPLYPGTGSINERGVGNIVNAPLPPQAGPREFRAAWDEILFPALENFHPQLLLVSAGFDAHRLDPLAQLQVETEDFAWITRRICELADEYTQGRVVSVLEGGYSLDALRGSVAAHVAELMKEPD